LYWENMIGWSYKEKYKPAMTTLYHATNMSTVQEFKVCGI